MQSSNTTAPPSAGIQIVINHAFKFILSNNPHVKEELWLLMVLNTFNPRIQEAEASEPLCLRPA